MSRLLRWQTIVKRLGLLAIALLAVQFALGLAARSIVFHSGEPAVAVRLDSTYSRVSLLKRQLVLDDVRIHSDDKATPTAIEFDRCTLSLAAKRLLHKQAIVESGSVTGLRFDDPHDSANSPDNAAVKSTSSSRWFRDDAADDASQWLQRVDRIFENDLVAQFESVRRTEALCACWPQESAAIDARLAALKKRSAELQADVRTAQSNPLRHVEFFNHLPEAIATLDQDFAKLAADAQALADSFEADRRAIVAARSRDEQFAIDQLRLEPVNAGALTVYLLREEVGKPLDEVIAWLRWARQTVPASASCVCPPSRGANVLFAGRRPAPGLLIRNLHLQGTARVAGQPVELVGTLADFSSAPARHSKPIQLRLRSSRSVPVQLQATVDRTGQVPRDELLLDCGGMVLPEMELGRQDQLSMSLAPSVGSLSVSVAVQGETLTGDIQLVQKQVKLTPALRGALRNAPLAETLKDALSNVDALALRISLSGTLHEPKCTLWSNLGAAVAESMDRALLRAGQQHAAALLARAQKQVDERLAGIERRASEQQAALTAQSVKASADLARIANQQAPAKRLSREQLGGRPPSGSLFR